MIERVKPSVLIVDDEADILFSLRSLLRQEFDVETAESGSQALELLARRSVQVIMTDQRMPGMTGAEFLRRSVPLCPGAVRIIFTGYADLKGVVDAVNHGHLFRYLGKPWDPDDLVEVIRSAVARQELLEERRRLLIDLRKFIGGQAWGGNAPALATQSPSPQADELGALERNRLLARIDEILSGQYPVES